MGRTIIVIPTLILHVISPEIYPLYDQHVERAKRVLLAQEVRLPRDEINLTTYEEYQSFFQEMIITCFGQQLNFENFKKVDNALWSFGKWFKDQHKSEDNEIKLTPGSDSKKSPVEVFKKEAIIESISLPSNLRGRGIHEA